MKISEIIKRQRGQRSLKQFGDWFGVAHNTVLYWENGKNVPDTDWLFEKLASDDMAVSDLARELLLAKHPIIAQRIWM